MWRSIAAFLHRDHQMLIFLHICVNKWNIVVNKERLQLTEREQLVFDQWICRGKSLMKSERFHPLSLNLSVTSRKKKKKKNRGQKIDGEVCKCADWTSNQWQLLSEWRSQFFTLSSFFTLSKWRKLWNLSYVSFSVFFCRSHSGVVGWVLSVKIVASSRIQWVVDNRLLTRDELCLLYMLVWTSGRWRQ